MSDPSSAAVSRALASVQRGAVEEAYHALIQAEAGGDAVAAATLAGWRLSGDVIRRDLAAARDHYGRAAALGFAAAVPIHIALLANGAGGSGRRWTEALAALDRLASADSASRRQSDLIAAMDLTADGEPRAIAPAEIVRDDPRILRFRQFLTGDECRYLIERAAPLLQPSVVVDPRNGQFIRDTVRTGRGAAFPFILEDPAIHAINRRIAAMTGTTYAQGEPVQVLAYAPGEEYRLHSDALPFGDNQRRVTFLVRLNEGFGGGETAFPQLGLSLGGGIGDALCFLNVDGQGRSDQRVVHAGRPVTNGTKYLLSKWIRARDLDLAGPPGRPF